MDYLASNNIPFIDFYEPDYDRGLTAIATAPLYSDKDKRIMEKFSLWKPIEEDIMADVVKTKKEEIQ